MKPRTEPKPTKEPYSYFQPGDIIYRIKGVRERPSSALHRSAESDPETYPPTAESEDHENNQSSPQPADKKEPETSFEQKIEKLIELSNTIATGLYKKQTLTSNITIKPRQERELYFPGLSVKNEKLEGEPLLGRRYRSPVARSRDAFTLVVAEARSMAGGREGFVNNRDLASFIAELEDQKSELKAKSGLDLEVVSPNWLSVPASEWGGGGGPGSRPTPYNGDPCSAPLHFQFPDRLKDLLSTDEQSRGAGVKVAILDTAPSMHELVWAYEKYHKLDPRNRVASHPLLERLLSPDGPLHVHPASTEDLFRMRAVHIRDHDYNMTSHGLFVAGIIHSIAPAAEIHLYEVLNSEGIGDMLTIYNALAKIAEDFKGERLVVNCSLTLTIPFGGNPNSPNTTRVLASSNPHPIVGHRLTDLYQSFFDKLQDDVWATLSCSSIESICDTLLNTNSRVIAAAGNDWVQNEDPGRPRARAIASFNSVQGVGAVPREQPPTAMNQAGKYEVSSYSDLSDEPSRLGIATLGGEPGEGKGVLGVYIGEFPAPLRLSFWQRVIKFVVEFLGGTYTGAPKNKSDLSWWAGTSFSTPILTGAIAAVLSNSVSPSTEEAIRTMYQCEAIEENRTRYEEDLLAVTQGMDTA